MPFDRRQLRRFANMLAPALTVVSLLLIWEFTVRLFTVRSVLFPSPTTILDAAYTVAPAEWAKHVYSTLRVALFGYLISVVVAVPIAVALALSPLLARSVYPLLVIVSTTPIVAVAPIIIVILGIGEASRIAITAIISFFPMVVSTTTGVSATPVELIELSRCLRAPKFREVLQIRLPYAVPHIFTGLKISITLAVIGAVVGEFVAGEKGLGFGILYSTSNFNIALSFAMLGALITISLVLFNLISLAQRLFFPWSLPKTT